MSDTGPMTATAVTASPGISWQDVFVPPSHGFLTGVPAFLGYAQGTGKPGEDRFDQPELLTLWPHFEQRFGPAPPTGYLAAAVRGFFENGGLLCYVVRLRNPPSPPETALAGALTALDGLDNVDLICAPDLMVGAEPLDGLALARIAGLQQQVLDHCRVRGDRFAILDCINTGVIGDPSAAPGSGRRGSGGRVRPPSLAAQRVALAGNDGALYHPWLLVPGIGTGALVTVPPCGHVAGVYSRTDQLAGSHRAPANEALEEPLDLRHHPTANEVGRLLDLGVNSIRSSPGRGVRLWGARTLGTDQDPRGNQVNVRRLLITVARWLEQFTASVAFEPNDLRLWLRIMRETSAYCEDLFRRGALKGRTAEEAFFVKCDGDTNPPEVIAAGLVVTEVGLAAIAPAEFIVVRIIHGERGVDLSPLGASA